MKRYLLIISLLCTFAGTVWAETITKTYFFNGTQVGTTNFGFFYDVEDPISKYNCYPATWTYGSCGSVSFTLADGITFTISDNNNQIAAKINNMSAIGGPGNLTVTLNSDTYFIRQVTLYLLTSKPAFDETNWGTDAESTKSFSKSNCLGYFNRLVITYSDKDIYEIDNTTTTLQGVEDEYEFAGSKVCPNPLVICNDSTLIEDDHYTVSYTNNNAEGTATVTVTGISPFHGSVSQDYTILPPSSASSWDWMAPNTIEITENFTASSINVTGSGNMTLKIAESKTLKVINGITIANGATLFVDGPGKLKVTNTTIVEDGINGAENREDKYTGGIGTTGKAGVKGTLTVNGGTVDITGGTGGNGGGGGQGGKGGQGGRGGRGISGTLTVNGGTVVVKGGAAGQGGHGGFNANGGQGGVGGAGIVGSVIVNDGTVRISGNSGGKGGIKGSGSLSLKNGNTGPYGQALGNSSVTVTCTAADHVIQDSKNQKTWGYLTSGSTSSLKYLRVIKTTPVTLYDNADNTSAILAAEGDDKSCTVTLSGRTFYKDGSWNTLCLPFDMDLTFSPLKDTYMDVRELTGSSFDSSTGTLTLAFTEGKEYSYMGNVFEMVKSDITSIEAGKPYLIRWGIPEGQPSENITDPIFTNVTIKSGTTNAITDYVDFIGTYGPTTYTDQDKSILLVGDENKLFYPLNGAHIGALRGYFQLKGITAGEVNNTRMWFGDSDSEDGIIDIEHGTLNIEHSAGAVYNLSGQKLSKPQKGINIVNGKKILF